MVAIDIAVLKQQATGDEDEIQKEHDHGQSNIHLPLKGCDGDDDEEQHNEQQEQRAGHARAAHFHRPKDETRQEPWKR